MAAEEEEGVEEGHCGMDSNSMTSPKFLGSCHHPPYGRLPEHLDTTTPFSGFGIKKMGESKLILMVYHSMHGFDPLTNEREWGARMTKASLVPSVTRKYEVIDQYVTVADEEEVKRKMRVSLPDDYAEKLCAQRNGTEESDMEIPEVKDYKPRKQLRVEVIEQEVYGIDPYTHNLLLDSMLEGSDWTILDKHLFVEDVLLCTLNKQVLKEGHGILDRHHLLVEACELNFVSEEDYIDLGRAGLGSCLLGGLPDWLIAYSARLVRFINFERTKLPEEILKHNLEEEEMLCRYIH
ncbi:unnamed protein product [Camellia sinensis]